MSFATISELTFHNEIIAAIETIKCSHIAKMRDVTEAMQTEITEWTKVAIEQINRSVLEEKKYEGIIAIPNKWSLYSTIIKEMINVQFSNEIFFLNRDSDNPPKYEIKYAIVDINNVNTPPLKATLLSQLRTNMFNDKLAAIQATIATQDFHIKHMIAHFNKNYKEYNAIAQLLIDDINKAKLGDGILEFMKAEILDLHLLTMIMEDKLPTHKCTFKIMNKMHYYELTYITRTA